jgi:predicted transcriptional regulator
MAAWLSPKRCRIDRKEFMDPNISRPDLVPQQSDCLRAISRAHIVRGMPAKQLTAEQKAEADALKALFKAYQAERKAAGEPWTQEELADEFGFGQSALSQYLNGDIPLNPQAVRKFADLLGVAANKISPTVVRQVKEAQQQAEAFLKASNRHSPRAKKRAA